MAETGRCFITTAFELCFKICHQESPRKSERTEIHELLAFADDVNMLDKNINTINKKQTVTG
jgi:hypothetical protein